MTGQGTGHRVPGQAARWQWLGQAAFPSACTGQTGLDDMGRGPDTPAPPPAAPPPPCPHLLEGGGRKQPFLPFKTGKQQILIRLLSVSRSVPQREVGSHNSTHL